MKKYTRTFDQLSTRELFAALHLRAQVFVVEQNCAYLDPDVYDTSAHHIYIWEADTLVAYARILPPNTPYVNPSIGRVVVHPHFRNLGIGKQVFAFALAEALRLFPNHAIQIMAQSYLLKFYADFGFVAKGDAFLEDGIPHVMMMYGLE